MRLNNLNVAFVYDRVNKFGGAERVLMSLHEIFPKAPIYTLVHESSSSRWTKKIQIISTFLNKIPFLRSRHELLAPLSPLAFETFNFKKYDLVISITSESAKGVITDQHTLHLCYCLTPTRYLWSASDEYTQNPGLGLISPLIRKILLKNIQYFQKMDLTLSSRPDHYLSISKEVQKRIKEYYGRNSEIIYPPIDYGFWAKPIKNKSDDYYLVVSRLVPYKKVDLVIKAFRELPDKKLLIVGTGSQLNTLRKMATKNTVFLGVVNDQKLRSLYANAKAVIFPQLEDFGLVPLEAQATGTPVLAYGKGGALETIINRKTGLFFNTQTTKAIIKSIVELEEGRHIITPAQCQKNAKKFNQAEFKKEFSDKVETLWIKHRKIITS